MSRQRQSGLGARRLVAIGTSAAFVLLMVFTGTVLGHNTSNSATFDCDGTVTYQVNDWTTVNTRNQALASDIQVWYSLDGAAYTALPDGAFTLGNYLTGFGGTFDGSAGTTVTIKANLAPATTWGDGDTADAGPWFSPTMTRSSCGTYHALPPTRIVDTRFATGLSGPLVSKVPQEFDVAGVGAIDSSAIAITGNLTVTGQTKLGYVSLTTVSEVVPPTSTINFPLGDDRANGVTLPLSADGGLWATYVGTAGATAQIIVDVTGYFTPDATGATFHTLTPARILDTRSALGLSGKFVSHHAREFAVAGQGGVDSLAIAVTGNLTVTGQTKAGYVALTLDSESTPGTSTINFPLGDTRANGVTVALNGDGDLWATYVASGTSATINLLFDVTGYFTADATGATYHTLAPARILDTREAIDLTGVFVSRHPREFAVAGQGGVASTAIAVTGNLTITRPDKLGYVGLTLTSQAAPGTSTINFPHGDTRANGVTAPLNGGGDLWATYVASGSTATIDVIFDVTGFYGP